MSLPLRSPFPPMEAKSVAEVPEGPEWQYEPKWDGFRCIVFRDGDTVELQSKSGQSLTRYFPELVAAVAALKANAFVLDGEIAVPDGKGFSFDALLQRIHPAKTRVERLSHETPAKLIMFDLLVDADRTSLVGLALEERRARLEAFAQRYLVGNDTIRLSPATTDLGEAQRWLQDVGATLDGIIAKLRNVPYNTEDRSAMQKIKNFRSADCVVGGFRYGTGSKLVGSLLLGLYDDKGLLNHVGFTTLKRADKPALTEKLEKLIGPPGFTGDAPGGPSRWSTERSAEWQPLKPKLVVEVCYDHFTGGRFRHGTRILRWRPDKAPAQCTYEQLNQKKGDLLRLLDSTAPRKSAPKTAARKTRVAAKKKAVRPAACRSRPAPRRRDTASR
jgi:ATP-dependent DNA ligase